MSPPASGARPRVAIVTGGASGIGRAISEELARRGVTVIVVDRQASLAQEVADGIGRAGGRASAMELDVRSFEAFRALSEAVLGAHHRIDYLFNNAGIGVGGEVGDYDVSDWDDVIDVNLRGVAYGIQAVYPAMIRQGFGHIVNTASMAGLVPAPEGSYTATKYAVVGLSRSLRVEARRHGVRVSVLCPGAIRTPILTGGKFGRIKIKGATHEKILASWERMRPMNVDVFAKKALDAVERDESVIVFPRWWKALWMIERFAPATSLRLWGVVVERIRKDLQ